ncbi:MAG: hypothetical protein ABEH56_06690 [Salinirussus sp.]
MYYVTRGLKRTLLRLARESEPEATTIPLSVTPAADMPGADLSPDTPVFTHFYMPEAGGSVNAVFGVDLGTPVAQTEGRFVSHPQGELGVSTEDDLHEIVFVAIPPWDDDSFAAFDRWGNRRRLTVVDAAPPEDDVTL